MEDNKKSQIDKTKISVLELDDKSDEREYLHSRTPEERLAQIEYLRRLKYGDEAVNGKVQRILEVVECDYD